MSKLTVTMKDVADAAGVSSMTVSRALKADSAVSEATRARVLRVVEDLKYVPDQMAGSLSSKRSGFVAVLVPSLNNLHFAETVQSLTNELESHGQQILLGYTDYSQEREERLIETVLRRRPEAMILSYDGHSERSMDLLRSANIPIVQIWERPEEPIEHSIGFSNEQAAFDMAKALIEKGYSKLTFLGEPGDDWTRGAARRSGFRAAMKEAGLDHSRLIEVGKPPISIEDGAAAVPGLLAAYPDTDCIFCVSDLPAFGVLSALKAKGLVVPDDIAVAGFGNFEVSRFSSPSITTVEVDPKSIGVAAGDLIGCLLKSPDAAHEARQIRVEARIVFRESTSSRKA